MMLKLASLALCLLHLAASMPAHIDTTDAARYEDVDNSESLIRHRRGASQSSSNEGEYYKSDEREGNGEIGYSRKKSGGGKKGYQHFDSYHKKAGDNYEFEKQDSYGQDEEAQDGAYSHRHERRAKKEHDHENLRDHERIREPEEFEDEQDKDKPAPKKKPKHRKDIDHAELREGADDGNGGVEAFGHDPNDYILPEKYVYGKEAEDENF
ncbi:uncharacterized protein LOC142974206 [Anticarsia gemmatalis]|uniref:uncharacterized protein LOC142974206 n=1 Tax=Anticarsia gemmatalis TaxID=129554 RepID=UPI003F775B38